MAALVELHTSSKKDNRNVWLVPVGTDVTTMNFFFALICRCLKLQKSLFLQLWITKVGIMMGPAVDTTARFSSYILRCRYVSIWCSLFVCGNDGLNCLMAVQFVVEEKHLTPRAPTVNRAQILPSIWWWEANISKAVYCLFFNLQSWN